MKQDVYTRVTDRIIADLEQGVRPWLKPWNAEHVAGKITRPLRHNGQPYSGVNVLMLWSEAMEKGYSAPIWMTFRQARELGAHVRKGEQGSLVVYANTLKRTEMDEDTGEEVERNIPFMKGYTVFNVEQIENLPAHYYATAEPPTLEPGQRIAHAEQFLARTGATVRHGGNQAYYTMESDHIQMPRLSSSAIRRATTKPACTKPSTGPATRRVWTGIWVSSVLATKGMPWKSLLPKSAAPSWPLSLI